jgi:hypothetical protein
MGIPQGVNRVRAQIFNRRGNFPGLERRPPLLNLADPANLESPDASIKAAAEIKQAEDLKKQKIKAIKYLAKIGCGCYDKDGKVTQALMASMDDCTEEVRLAAVEAIKDAAEGECCSNCSQRCCCNEEIVEKLSVIAYERDEEGCWVEPSERVREAAAEALCICCPGQQGAPIVEPTPAIEGGEPAEAVEGFEEEPAPTPPREADEARFIPAPATSFSHPPTQLVSSRRRYQSASQPARATARMEEQPRQEATPLAPVEEPMAPVHEKVHGSVAHVNLQAGLVQLHLHEGVRLPPGTTVKVYHRYLTGTAVSAILEVIDSRPGTADARPVNRHRMPKIARGDEFEAWR